MERSTINDLVRWQHSREHMPLLIRGARQVGKTHIVQQFGQQCFDQILTVNFEEKPDYHDCFETLGAKDVLSSIEALSQQKIIPTKTLLFFDEIQECPRAIMAMRYFKEQIPELHVVGAGSLLEFALNSDEFRMPVGRVEFMYMYPISFHEFLLNSGNEKLIEMIQETRISKPLPIVIHKKLLSLVRTYISLGGMPAVVKRYIHEQNLLGCRQLQVGLLNTYRTDFGKYSRKTNHRILQQVFNKIPRMVGQQIKYSKIAEDIRSRELKQAIESLTYANLIIPNYATSASGLPLNATRNEKKFKLLFVDVGLVSCNTQVELATLLKEDLLLLNKGALAEQFVGQELLAYMPSYVAGELFYWVREKRGSSAEVDYVVYSNEAILPIEVKSGKTGSLRSLQRFLQEKNTPLGIRISTQALSLEGNVLSIPLYMVKDLNRLVKEAMSLL